MNSKKSISTLGYKLVKKVNDDSFNVENISRYTLVLQIGKHDIQIGIADLYKKKTLQLYDYICRVEDDSTHQEWIDLIKKIFDKHHTLQARFWRQVIITIKNDQFVHVPAALFDAELVHDYLKFNTHFDVHDAVVYYRDQQAELVTVFSVLKPLYEWLREFYMNVTLTFIHQSSAFVQGYLELTPKLRLKTKAFLYVYVDRFSMHIVSVKNGHLVFYNQFNIREFSDYVHFITQVLHAQSMTPSDSSIVVWGYLGNKTPHYQEFCRYVRNVSLGVRPTYLLYGSAFDEIEDHQYFDVFSSFLTSA